MQNDFPLKEINLSRLLSEFSEGLKNKITAITTDGQISVYLKEALTTEETAELSTVITAHDGTPTAELRVHRVLSKNLDHRTSDFSILGFRKSSPKYVRGRKVEADYMCIEKDEVIVKKLFSDVRNEEGILTGLKVNFEWWDENNQVGDVKEEIVKTYNQWEAQTEERKRRDRQIDFLVAEGIRSNTSQYIDLVFGFFKLEIDKYRASGSNAWELALRNHAPKFINDDPGQGPDATAVETQVYGILETIPENNLSVKEAILYQICGEWPARLGEG